MPAALVAGVPAVAVVPVALAVVPVAVVAALVAVLPAVAVVAAAADGSTWVDIVFSKRGTPRSKKLLTSII